MQFGCPHCGKELKLMIERLKKERDHRGEPSPESVDLIEFFRSNYLKVVDPQFQGFKKPYPVAEVKAAEYFMKFYKDAVRSVISWVARDQVEEGRWKGWATQIRSLAKLKEKWAVLEQKARQSGSLALPSGKGARPSDLDLRRLIAEETSRLQRTSPVPSYEGLTNQQFVEADLSRDREIARQAKKNVAERLGIQL